MFWAAFAVCGGVVGSQPWPPNVLIHSLPNILSRLPFLFHLIPFQKYPSLIKNRRNRTAAKTILFPFHPFASASTQNYILFRLFTKNPFFSWASHTIPGPVFWPFSEKGDHQRFLREKLFSHPHLLPVPLLTFSCFPPHTPYIFIHIFLEIQNYSLRSSGHLCWLENGYPSAMFRWRSDKAGVEGCKMYTFMLYHDDDSYSNYNLNGQPYDTHKRRKGWRKVISLRV